MRRLTLLPDTQLTHVDLTCQGETEDAWLLHGFPGDPVQHLALSKEQIPRRVAWVRVILDIHLEPMSTPKKTLDRIQGRTSPNKKDHKKNTRGRTKSS